MFYDHGKYIIGLPQDYAKKIILEILEMLKAWKALYSCLVH